MRIKDLIPWSQSKEESSGPNEPGTDIVRHEADNNNSLAPLQNELNSVFDRFFERFDRPFRNGGLAGIAGAGRPSIDISETDDAVTISADLPGLEEKDIDVSLSGDVLTLRGERSERREDKGKGYVVHERSYGSFFRSIPLPAGLDHDKVKAEFRNGVLDIELPKTADARRATRKIEIQTA